MRYIAHGMMWSNLEFTLLLKEIGLAGYGVYWILNEILMDGVLKESDLELLAMRLDVDVDLINRVVYNYNLFVIEGDEIRSRYVEQQRIRMEAIAEKKRKGALKRWGREQECNSETERWYDYLERQNEERKRNYG